MRKVILLFAMLVGVMFNLVANDFAVQGKRITILPFMVKGNFDALYAEVALDNFTMELAKNEAYQVIQGAKLDKAMKQLKIQNGDNFDEANAIEVGKLTGAEIVVIGVITALKSQTVVNIRGINVNTGIDEFAEREFIKSQEQLLTVAESMAKKFSKNSANQDYADNKKQQEVEPVDFSVKEDFVNNADEDFAGDDEESVLTESQERFVQKFFNLKLGIDPFDMSKQDIRRVYWKHKMLLAGGISLSVLGGVSLIPGVIFMGIGIFVPYIFFPMGAVFLAGAITMGCCSIMPFKAASKVTKIVRTIHGESLMKQYFKTFKKKAATDYEDKNIEIALLGCSF